MKLYIELNYDLQEEPSIFSEIETIKTRKIYLWGNKKASLEQDSSYISYVRASQTIEEPDSGFLEVWAPITASPPQKVDDSWIEEFKIIEHSTVSLEWHPKTKTVRLCWHQLAQSYQEGLVKAAVLNQLQSLSLELPPLVKVELQ